MIMTTNSTTTSYRLMIPGEEEKVSKLVRRVFMKFISPEYSAEGVDEYLRYISPEALAQRSKTGHFVI
ncbi:MAG: GNAT family N-acetyltransferase, partial [Anaerolineaceae bacterium]|nr:GNAT family N-acetyltransferase [Anaerolineaceae bacterium]